MPNKRSMLYTFHRINCKREVTGEDAGIENLTYEYFKEASMKKTVILISLVCAMLAGCAPAIVTSAKWDSGVNSANIETRCEHIDMRVKSEMDSVFTKYDGWKLIYISEYTTENKFGTDAAVCFEHVK